MLNGIAVLNQLGSVDTSVLTVRVEETARKINAIVRATTLEFAFEIGKTVIDDLYAGQLNEWRHRGRKEAGLRELAAHPALSISATTLYRSLAIYELCVRLGCRDKLRNLGVSHLRAILTASEGDQAQLITRADAESWSVARLEREVAERVQVDHHKGGRPRSPGFIKSIRRMGQLTNPEALEGLDEVDRLEPEEAQELLRVVTKVRERMSLIERVLVRPARDPRNTYAFSRAAAT